MYVSLQGVGGYECRWQDGQEGVLHRHASHPETSPGLRAAQGATTQPSEWHAHLGLGRLWHDAAQPRPGVVPASVVTWRCRSVTWLILAIFMINNVIRQWMVLTPWGLDEMVQFKKNIWIFFFFFLLQKLISRKSKFNLTLFSSCFFSSSDHEFRKWLDADRLPCFNLNQRWLSLPPYGWHSLRL